MPLYDTILLIRKMDRPHLKEVLTRTANYVLESGATFRRMENLGLRNLPYKIRSNGKTYIHAHCFIFNHYSGLEGLQNLKEKLKVDMDVVRATHYQQSPSVQDFHTEKPKPECTLHEDLLPPPYRKNVIDLQEIAKKRIKKHSHKNYDDTDYIIY